MTDFNLPIISQAHLVRVDWNKISLLIDAFIACNTRTKYPEEFINLIHAAHEGNYSLVRLCLDPIPDNAWNFLYNQWIAWMWAVSNDNNYWKLGYERAARIGFECVLNLKEIQIDLIHFG